MKYVFTGEHARHLKDRASARLAEPAINWSEIKRFNFTYAIPGGAWLEDAAGVRAWVSFREIIARLGEDWLTRAHRAQGLWTGTWIEVQS